MGVNPPLSEKMYVTVAVDLFNVSAITFLFYILYKSEKETAENFGSVMRDNIATIIVALLMALVKTAVEIAHHFT